MPLDLPVYVDSVRIFFLFSVTLISLAVYWFSLEYMSHEKFFFRFHGLVLLFVLSMFALIVRPRLISVLLG